MSLFLPPRTFHSRGPPIHAKSCRAGFDESSCSVPSPRPQFSLFSFERDKTRGSLDLVAHPTFVLRKPGFGPEGGWGHLQKDPAIARIGIQALLAHKQVIGPTPSVPRDAAVGCVGH